MELRGEASCCKNKYCKLICEENTACSTIGKFGLSSFDRHRGKIMLTACFLSIVSVILDIVPIVSTSFNRSDVQNTAWTYGESESGDKLWIGLNMVVVEVNGKTSEFGWNSDTCSTLELTNQDFCHDCKSSCLRAEAMVIINLINSFPNIKGNIERSTRVGDRNRVKVPTLVTGIIGTVTVLIALSTYSKVCHDNLPHEIGGESIDYMVGPGFICLLVATLLRPINIIVNLLMPVIPPDES
jgi:hypothetical protein